MESKQQYKFVDNYKHYNICRLCFSKKLSPFLCLGNIPLAGGFLKSKNDFQNEKFYPLEISFCENCFLVQSINAIDRDILFKDYFYHSSAIKTLTNHFINIAKELVQKTQSTSNPFIVEIGCNDGILITEFKKTNIKALGIDPAGNIVKPLIKKGFPIINDYFSETLAKTIVKKYGKADIVCSFNVLAHIENMHDVIRGIKILLKNGGSLIFETHYLGKLLKEKQYDMIYHEHQYYYSLMALQKFFAMHDMEIYDARPTSIHAGSMRYYVQNKKFAKNAISKNVEIILRKERELKLHKLNTYLSFAKKISKTKQDILSLLDQFNKQNKKVAGYGASGRGTVVMNYCGLDGQYLDYIIDDAPAKQGAYTPGRHIKIVSSRILQTKKRPDYIVLFAWSFLDEIKKKNKKYLETGGKFLLPLPKVKIIDK